MFGRHHLPRLRLVDLVISMIQAPLLQRYHLCYATIYFSFLSVLIGRDSPVREAYIGAQGFVRACITMGIHSLQMIFKGKALGRKSHLILILLFMILILRVIIAGRIRQPFFSSSFSFALGLTRQQRYPGKYAWISIDKNSWISIALLCFAFILAHEIISCRLVTLYN